MQDKETGRDQTEERTHYRPEMPLHSHADTQFSRNPMTRLIDFCENR